MLKFRKFISVFASLLSSALMFVSCAREPSERIQLNYTVPKTAGTVSMNGTAYSSLQEAWAVIGTSGDYEISLSAGLFDLGTGQLSYRGAANVKIKGPAPSEKVQYGLNCFIKSSMKNDGTLDSKKRSLISFGGTGNLVLENVTLFQSAGASGNNQLETVGYDASGICAAYNCSFLSHQDTLRTTGKAWFYKCYVEGDVDFLWMETGGKVALYEDCILCSVNDRTNKAYFTAPRASSTANPVYKGLVVYNCQLWGDCGETYLGRNPWSKPEQISQYYNNVAFVGTKVTKGSVKNEFQSDCNRNSEIFFTGFNTDSNFKSPAKGENFTKEQVAAEYNGRNRILNRCYNVSQKAIVKDSVSFWDIEKFITDNGWTASADSSTAE